MDFELSDDQRAVVDAVLALCVRHAGPKRAVELRNAGGGCDAALLEALAAGGYADIARQEGMGLLEATLVAEVVSRHAGVVPYGAQAIVAAGLTDQPLVGPVALAHDWDLGEPVRFAAHARTLIFGDDDGVRLIPLAAGDAEPVRSDFGYPMGRLVSDFAGRGADLGAGAHARLASLWRLALAIEIVGAMDAALSTTVDYLKVRKQFGRTIGSFQAVQHRLAECKVLIEGARWLAFEAAHKGAPAEGTATAAAYAAAAATRVARETHQLSGAIGFTREYDLHVWTLRLQALSLELGGVSGHRRVLAALRWGLDTDS
ncbi:MAG: acyl-CoA dehydrogenase [Deltaproteobacteria bacterium]|nr:acyl-CoA dehydrogenase [Deltaproteobacteria bacterium]